ncbi:hypothetical protein M405DRAFT_862868 [Rhizopogon salebrosus TDB-379]|nr:hypothetical protein M405DRAFT_862868 [Rhizopogon salebrosus TDB-379]
MSSISSSSSVSSSRRSSASYFQTPLATNTISEDVHLQYNLWMEIILQPEYTITLDHYFTENNDFTSLRLITAFRAAAAIATEIGETHEGSRLTPESFFHIQYQSLLNPFPFHPKASASPTPTSPPASEQEFSWDSSPLPTPVPPPTSSPSNITPSTIIEGIVLTAQAIHTTPPPAITSVQKPAITPPSSPKTLALATQVAKSSMSPSHRHHKRMKEKYRKLLSFGLPLSQVYPTEVGNQYNFEMAHEIAVLDPPPFDNFICRVCRKPGHKQVNCPHYHCRICKTWAPCHYSCFCPKLKGKRLLRTSGSDPDFINKLWALEDLFDKDVEEDEKEVSAMMANVDLDPCWYDNCDQ